MPSDSRYGRPATRWGVRRPVSLLLLLTALTFFLGLGRQAVTDSDEAYYAEASREMVDSGDWLTPHFNFEDRWQKPVLYYWLTATTYLVTGPAELSARLWSALSGAGLVLLTWLMARRAAFVEGDRVQWVGAAIVATCFGYFAMARLALPDLPLTFLITLTIWATLEQRLTLAGLGAGLGFLMKGPVALAVPAMVLLPILWHERVRLRVKDVLIAGAIAAAVGLPWYVAMTATHGVAYLQSFFIGDNLERFATSRYNDPRNVWFYVPIVIGGMLPWSMFLIVLPWRRALAVVRRRTGLSPIEWRLLLWVLIPLIFYTLSIGKQPRYVLPVLPPLAILLARSLVKRTDRDLVPGDTAAADPAVGDDGGARGLLVGTLLTAALFLVLGALLYRARPLFITAQPGLTWAGIVALVGMALLMAAVALRRAWRTLPSLFAAAGVVVLLTFQFGALAGVRPEPVEQMASLVSAYRTGEEPLGVYEVFVRNLVFYTHVRQTTLLNDTHVRDFLNGPAPVLLVIRASDRARVESLASVPLHLLGSVVYVDTARIRLRTLLQPNPATDLETILLVTNR